MLECSTEMTVPDDDSDLFWVYFVLSLLNVLAMAILTCLKLTIFRSLDRGQLWAFSIALSLVQFVAMVAAGDGDYFEAGIAHICVGALVIALLVFLRFGFHLRLLDRIAEHYFW